MHGKDSSDMIVAIWLEPKSPATREAITIIITFVPVWESDRKAPHRLSLSYFISWTGQQEETAAR